MITYKTYNDASFEFSNFEFFNDLLKVIKDRELLSTSIDEIIITDEIDEEIKKYCETRFRTPSLSKSREYKSVSKTISFGDKNKVFFDALFLHKERDYAPQIFFEHLIDVYAEDIVYSIRKYSKIYNEEDKFSDVIKIHFNQWASKVVASKFYKSIEYDKINIHNDVKIFVDTFKRNIRKHHFSFQKDSDSNLFKLKILNELDHFIKRCLDVKVSEGNFTNLQEFSEVIPEILSQIEIQSNNLFKREEVLLNKLNQYIKELLKHCFIDILSEEPFDIQISESPKKLFKGNIIDTETRIVAFVDILGFKSIIEEYDSDSTSNLLNELHEALNTAIENAIEEITNSKAKSDLQEFLEYRMFSDCLCVSLPFIEYGNDFELQLNSICTIVASYQFLMMQKGFFVRGGIAIGSYYSDKNMIFSGGLVSAYNLDKGTPVIALDKSIVDRLLQNTMSNSRDLFYGKMFLYAVNESNKIFINPYYLLDNATKSFEIIKKSMNELFKESNEETTEPIEKLMNSSFKILESLTNDVFEYAKSQITTKDIDKEKAKVLVHVTSQIEKLSKIIQNQSKSESEKQEATKILNHYNFIGGLCLWSLNRENEDFFFEFQFS